ncbi:hypothetical protein [Rhodococcus sp. B10]|uniref:hypothetical protein n=1 Tax=Rhodococcus sp. B10 TaxID=2695876 RepID=UPI0016BA067F|nr:hypothetical protein [Rhodococcus sp. B10]NIL78356.1 hypothetical protein [Rhodococcus sp. B10]
MNESTSTHPGPSVTRGDVTTDELADIGVDIAVDFPGSTAADFQRYPVLSEGGWFIVIKHQPSLTSVSRTPWTALGPIELTSKNLNIY